MTDNTFQVPGKPLNVTVPVVIELDLAMSLLESAYRTTQALGAWVESVEPAPKDTALWQQLDNKAPSDQFAEFLMGGGMLWLHFYDTDEKPRSLDLGTFCKGVGLYLADRLKDGDPVRGPEGWDANMTANAIEWGLFGKERFF